MGYTEKETYPILFSNLDHDFVIDGEAGKLYARAVKEMGVVEANKVYQKVPEEFEKDYMCEQVFQLAELWSNIIISDMYGKYNIKRQDSDNVPQVINMGDVVEENVDHGYDHVRRLEKWYKEFVARNPEFRSNLDFAYFSLSTYMALRLHDIFQTVTGKKEAHPEAAALFSLGYLLKYKDEIMPEVSEEDWNKIAWGTAFACLNHMPDSVPSLDQMVSVTANNENLELGLGVDTELFEPQKLKDTLIESLQKSDDDFEVDELAIMEETFAPLNDVLNVALSAKSPKLQMREIKALRKQTVLVGVVDKMDTMYPPIRSVWRMLITKPNRPFYEPIDVAKNESEFEVRIEDGNAPTASCDFNRMLLELTRLDSLVDADFSAAVYLKKIMMEKIDIAMAMVNVISVGDHSLLFEQFEIDFKNELYELLVNRVGIPAEDVRNIGKFSIYHIDQKGEYSFNNYEDIVDNGVKALLKKNGFSPNIFGIFIEKYLKDYNLTLSAISQKITKSEHKVGSSAYSDMMNMLAMAKLQLKIKIRKLPFVLEDNLGKPYHGYFHVPVIEN